MPVTQKLDDIGSPLLRHSIITQNKTLCRSVAADRRNMPMDREPAVRTHVTEILTAGVMLSGLYTVSRHNYLLFHSLSEFFSIIVAFAIYMVAWNSRRFLENPYILFLGISYPFIAGIDLLHTLAYKGMGVFPGAGSNLPTQLWIIARYLESLAFLIAPVFLRHRRLNIYWVITGYGIVLAAILASVFYWRIFPACFIEGQGLTDFKKISEYLIILVLMGSVALLVRKRNHFEPGIFKLLVASISMTIAAEACFTVYASAYGSANLFGHFFKILSYYLIYKALIETGLVRPYTLLFRNLKLSETSFRESQRKLSTLLGNLPGMVYRCLNDKGWTMEYVSQGCETLTGYESSDLLMNKTVAYNDLIDPEDREKVWNQVQEAVQQKQPFKLIYRIHTRGGDKKWVWEQGLAVYNQYGTVKALEGFITDISDRIRAEEERLQREKLQSVLEIAGAICHELNQPLQGITGFADLLMLTVSPDDPIYNKIRIIFEKAGEMGRITNKLMKITEYKTKDYAKGIRIIDIDKSSEEPPWHLTSEQYVLTNPFIPRPSYMPTAFTLPAHRCQVRKSAARAPV